MKEPTFNLDEWLKEQKITEIEFKKLTESHTKYFGRLPLFCAGCGRAYNNDLDHTDECVHIKD